MASYTDPATARRRIARLRRRADWLDERIEARVLEGNPNAAGRDRAELSALRWALGQLEDQALDAEAVAELRPTRFHELKTWPEPFAAVWEGDKRGELRPDDREFAVGDGLILREYDPKTRRYSGRKIMCRISHAMRGEPLIPAGFALLSIEIHARGPA